MRGCIYKRSKNSWTVVVELPRDPVTKKRRQKSFTVKGNKKDAERELARIINELETGMFVEPSKMTLGEYLDKWLETKKGKIKETTLYQYCSIVRKIKTFPIVSKMIQTITALDIEFTIAKAEKNKIRMYDVLRAALRKAVKMKLILYNPAEGAERPKMEEREISVWTKGEAVQFLLTVKKSQTYYPLFFLALKTGLRLGEILALKWEKVDLDKREIYVDETVAETNTRKTHSPKTKKSKRKVPIDSQTVEVLRQHKVRQAEKMLRSGLGQTPFVFPSSKNNSMPPLESTIRKALDYYIKKAKVKRIRFHDLRHTHATFLLEAGVHPKIVAERLGHASLKEVDRYTHVLPHLQQKAVRAMEDLSL